MNRQQYGLSRWCDKVVSYIYFTPDRERVRQELMWHLEDTAEALAEQGVTEDEIVERTTSAMGDPRELGLLLRRVYKPWLTYACWAAMVLAAVLVAALVISLSSDRWRLQSEINHLFRPEVNYENYYGYYAVSKYVDENGNIIENVEYPKLIADISPGGKARCGVYTFQVTDGWIIETDEEYRLVLVLSYSSPRFWTGSPVPLHFRLESSTGRVDSVNTGNNMYYHWPSASDTAYGEYVLTLRDFEPGTQWVDIVYEKGEGLRLRVYLPEGGDWA